MDVEKFVGQLAISVPVMHVVACSLFLVGYSAGFGSEVASLFAVSDFFTISIDHLVRMYAIGIGLPLAFLVYRHRSGFAYAADEIAAEEDCHKREKLIQSRRNIQCFITCSLMILSLISISTIILSSLYDIYRIYSFPVLVLTAAMSIPYWRICEKIGFYGMRAEVAFISICFASALISMGMDEGFSDRRSSISQLEGSAYTCGKYRVVGAVGQRFIAASTDRNRHVINEECEVLFDFPQTPTVRRMSIVDAVIGSIRGWWIDKPAPNSGNAIQEN